MAEIQSHSKTKRLQELFKRGRAVLKQTAGTVWEMGKIASEVKAELPHGEFQEAIRREWGITYQSARNFINVFQQFPDLPQKLNNLTFDVAPTVLYLLSESSVSDEIREAAVEKIEAGEITSVADAKEFIGASTAPNEEPMPDPFDDTTPEAEAEPEPPETDLQQRAAAATVVRDTISNQPPEPDESDLTDDEWLITLPLFEYLVANGGKALLLRTDALAWRSMQQMKAFGSFKHSATRAFDFNQAATPLSQIVSRACYIKHPKEWGACVKCRAKGCSECGYAGYALENGLTVEQLGAR